MNKKTLLLIIPVSLMISSCADTPDSIKSNTHSTSDSTQIEVSDAQGVYSDIDLAYDSSYTKISLPDKESINVQSYDEIDSIELCYINSQLDQEYMTDVVDKLSASFGVLENVQTQTDDYAALRDDEKSRVKIEAFSRPYVRVELEDSDVCNANNGTVIKNELVILDQLSDEEKDNVDAGVLEASDKALETAQAVGEIFGDQLEYQVSDAYILYGEDDDVGYEIEIQKCYNGIAIQNLVSPSASASPHSDGAVLMSASMQSYADIDSDGQLLYYIGCDSFTVESITEIEDVITFKGACDILESELSDNVHYDFDSVQLMYEPYGYEVVDYSEAPKNITCTPKWYFIINKIEEESGMHMINYITVDVKTGEINVVM